MGFSLGSLYDDVVNGGAARTQSEAAQNAASATQAAADQTKKEAVSAAAASPEELLSLSNSYSAAVNFMGTQMNNLQTSMSLLNSTQPALMQAGLQAWQLMTGQEAASLAPIKNERSLQRNQLENSLRDRMGSGYATSSSGMEALSQFDQQTMNLMNNAQQQAIGQYLGISAAVMPNMVNLTNSVYGEGSNLNSAFLANKGNIANRNISAITGTAQNMINTAGAPWVGASTLSGMQAGYGNTLAGFAIGAGVTAMGAPSSGPKMGNQTNGAPSSGALGGGGAIDLMGSNPYSN